MKVPQGVEIYHGGKCLVAGQEIPVHIKMETEPVATAVAVAKKAKVTDEPTKSSGE